MVIKLFEEFNSLLDLKNEVLNCLSQYPYLVYSIREVDTQILLSFNKDVNLNYINGILNQFIFDVNEKFPVKITIKDIKNQKELEKSKDKIIINNTEKIDIPRLGIFGLEVKIDTGATTSSLDVSYMKIDRAENVVRFKPLHPDNKEFNNKIFKIKMNSIISVQSSDGYEEQRPLIQLTIIIRGKKFKTFFSLSDREDLTYPILIGKDILSGNFLINPSM